MDWGSVISTTIAAFLTLAIFSFLYKDNPFYKFAEHLVVGVTAGYWVVIFYYTVVMPNIIERLQQGKWWYVIPLCLGILMWTRLVPKWTWISRYPLALYLGVATGAAIPLEMKAKVVEHLNGSVALVTYMHSPQATTGGIINNVIILLGLVAALIYFFFSKEHKGAIGLIAKVGIVVLMVGFGASFGFTVMARVSLLIDRFQFLVFTWLNAASWLPWY